MCWFFPAVGGDEKLLHWGGGDATGGCHHPHLAEEQRVSGLKTPQSIASVASWSKLFVITLSLQEQRAASPHKAQKLYFSSRFDLGF